MSRDITEETLVEGRTALYQLERHLKDRGITFDNGSEASGSKQHSSASERRLLDQLPRVIRLNNRLESLGLTVEVSAHLFRGMFLYLINRSSMIVDCWMEEGLFQAITPH